MYRWAPFHARGFKSTYATHNSLNKQHMGSSCTKLKQLTLPPFDYQNFLRGCASGETDEIIALLDAYQSADLEYRDRFGMTGLHWAACGGHVDIMKYMLERGLDPDVNDSVGRSALLWAARHGQVKAGMLANLVVTQ